MGDVKVLMMDAITKKSNHVLVPNAVSVCITPAAPSPLPIPYPVIGNVSEGIVDEPLRTKINGTKIGTTGSVAKACHGNEPGTMKEVVSFNTAGPCFIIIGAPVVLCELGMMGMTGSLCISNKQITVGAPGGGSGAGGSGGAGGGGGGSGSGSGSPGGTGGPGGGGGSGGGGSNTGASAPTPEERALAAAPGDSPEQRAAREKVVRDFAENNGNTQAQAEDWMGYGGTPQRPGGRRPTPSGNNEAGIDISQPVEVRPHPPPDQMDQYVGRKWGTPGQWFDPVGGQTGEEVGLNTDPSMRDHRTFNVPPGEGLHSTAGPVTDTWTDPNNPQFNQGGGEQLTVPKSTSGGATCTTCGQNKCTCPRP